MKYKHINKIRRYDNGGEVLPDSQMPDNSIDLKKQALQQFTNPISLSSNDFTQPGEMIPKEGGLANFIKYNLAHRNPQEDAANMAMGLGGIEKIGGDAIQAVKPIIEHALTNPENFSNAVNEARQMSPLHQMNISPYTTEDYSKFRTYLSPDAKSGYAIKPDGELTSVFSTEKGRGNDIVSHAVKNGASKLDAYDINNKLPELYSKHGFQQYKKEANYEPGGPDVSYMAIPEKHPDLFSKINEAKQNALKKIME